MATSSTSRAAPRPRGRRSGLPLRVRHGPGDIYGRRRPRAAGERGAEPAARGDARGRVALLVFPSSGGTVYGDDAPEGGSPETATSPPGTYGLGKRLIEEILLFRARAGGPHRLVLRIANAYGPTVHGHHRQGVINAFLDRARAGEPVRIWGDGSAVRDYVHVEDILSALSALVRRRRDELFNSGAAWA